MFEAMVGLVATLVALALLFAPLASLAVSLSLRRKVATLEARLAVLEAPGGRVARAAPSAGLRAQAPVADEPVAPSVPSEAAMADEPVEAPVPSEAAVPAAPAEAPEPTEPEPAPAKASPAGAAPVHEEIEPVVARPRPAPVPLSPERLAVWFGAVVGGLAMVLGFLLALKVAIDAGLVSPPVRVVGGLLAGTGSWAAGAWRRRATPWFGASLSGIGLSVLYGTLYAATELYGLWPTGVGFVGMGVVTAAGLAWATVVRDRLVADLALLGGLLTPVVLSTGEPRPEVLYGYLALLVSGSLAGAMRYGWGEVLAVAWSGVALLSLATSAGSPHSEADAAGASWHLLWGALGPALLTAPFFLAAVRGSKEASSKADLRDLASLAAASLPGLALPWAAQDVGLGVWPATGIVLGVALSGWWLGLRGRRTPLAGLSALCATALVAAGSMAWVVAFGPHHGGHLVPLALLTLAPLVAVTAMGWRREDHWWSTDAVAFVLLAPAVAALDDVGGGGLWWLAVPVVFVGLSHLSAWSGSGVRVVAAALTAAVSLVAVAEDPAPQLTLVAAGALLATGTWPAVWIVGSSRQRWSWPVIGLLPLALVPAVWLAWDDLGWDHGSVTLVALGAHVVVTSAALVGLRRVPEAGVLHGLHLLIGLGLLTAALPVELERSWLTLGVSLEAAALALWTLRTPNAVVAVVAVAAGTAVGVRLLLNPASLSYGTATGWPLLNWTLYTWGVPAVALGVASWGMLRGRFGQGAPGRWSAGWLALLSCLVGFALVNVEISHAFQADGPLELLKDDLVPGMVRSLAWVGYGVALLVVAVWRQVRLGRLVGFGFLLLGTLKVFAVDLWSLSGIARVGSVFGLAVSLLLAAFLFERLVLRGDQDRTRSDPQ